jgi:hypothetical protein
MRKFDHDSDPANLLHSLKSLMRRSSYTRFAGPIHAEMQSDEENSNTV